MSTSGYAVRMLWQDSNQGISETYYYNSTTTDVQGTVYPAALTLMKYRTALMGFGVIPISFRISQIGNFRAYLNSNPKDIANIPVGSALVSLSLNAQQVAAGVSPAADGSADEANVTIIVTAFNGLTTHSRRFMSGIPDVLVRTDPNGPWIVGVPAWWSLFQQYATYLTSNAVWTFKTRVPASSGGNYNAIAIQKPWFQQDPVNSNTYDILLNLPNPTPIAAGVRLQIRGCKMTSKAYVNPNGVYTVGSVSNGPLSGQFWVQILGSSAWAVNQVQQWGSAFYVDYQLNSYTGLFPTGQGSHKRGNRSLAAPGKRRTVQRVSS